MAKHFAILVALLVGIPLTASAQLPGLPALPGLPDLPATSKKAKKKKKRAKAKPKKKQEPKKVTALGESDSIIRSLAEFGRTERYEVKGPGKLTVKIQSQARRTVRVIVARGSKKLASLQIKKRKTARQQFDVPAGTHVYNLIAIPRRRLAGKLTLSYEADSAIPAMPPVAAATTGLPAMPGMPDVPPMPTAPPEPVPTATPLPKNLKGMKILGKPSKFTLNDPKRSQFYQLSGSKNIEVAVTGPGSLWVELRRNMSKGGRTKALPVEARLNGDLLWTYAARGMPSEEKYREQTHLLPSGGERIEIAVPSGIHKATLRLPAGDAQGVGISFDYGSAKAASTTLVAKGTYLTRIAQATYGEDKENLWTSIYEVNKQMIGEDPHKVAVGTKLVIPSRADAERIASWINAGKQGAGPAILSQLKGQSAQLSTKLNQSPTDSSINRYRDAVVESQVQTYLEAMVLSGAVQPANFAVEMSDPGPFSVVGVDATIDDKPIELFTQGKDPMQLLPGPHRFDAVVKVRARPSASIHVKQQRFEVKGGTVFFVKAGETYRGKLKLEQSDNLALALQERIELHLDVGQTPNR